MLCLFTKEEKVLNNYEYYDIVKIIKSRFFIFYGGYIGNAIL